MDEMSQNLSKLTSLKSLNQGMKSNEKTGEETDEMLIEDKILHWKECNEMAYDYKKWREIDQIFQINPHWNHKISLPWNEKFPLKIKSRSQRPKWNKLTGVDI